MGEKPSVQKRGWIIIILGEITALSIIGFALGNIYLQDQKRHENLVSQAKFISQAIDSEVLLQLSGTSADQSSPYYQHLKQQLMATRRIFPDVRLMYVLGQKEDGSIFYYIDSEPPGTSTESLPGDSFVEATEEQINSFKAGIPMSTGLGSDQWGTWMTTLYPIRDADSGEVIAAFGMDIDAQDWLLESIKSASIPIVIFVILVILIIGTVHVFQYRHKNPETYRKHFITRYALVICTGLLGGCLIALSVWYTRSAAKTNQWESFDRLAGFHAETITASFNNIDRISLESIKQFYQGSDYVTREEFSKFTEHLLKEPFITAWVWIPEIQRDQFQAFESAVQQEGYLDFQIWKQDPAGQRIPSIAEDSVFPISYLSPPVLEEQALGYDIASDEDQSKLLLFTMETGITTATDVLTFANDNGESNAILVYKSVTLEDNPSGQVGVIAAIVRTEQILKSVHLESIREELNPKDSGLYTDIFQIDYEKDIQLLSSTSPESYKQIHQSSNLQEHIYAEFTFTKPLFVYGKTYVIVSHPSPGFYQSHPASDGRTVAVSGVILTILVMLLVGNYADRNYILSDMVKQRTIDLEESERRFQIALKNSPVIVFQQDEDFKYTWIHNLNPDFETLTIIGKTDNDLLARDEALKLNQLKRQAIDTGKSTRQIVQVTVDGKRYHYDMTIEPIHSETGKNTGITCSCVDISELVEAYDATIEGWSRALELRDEETEGHTLRVAEMTLKLAAAMGIGEEELVHIRRGALLHDIGKIGIPDEILLKPGKLNDEEWEIMKQHPVFAYNMLSRITYLESALNIPYCHHEKWDGSGYPQGLKGEQIPLAARIFAIIDVWDALRSDRPYRKAWPEDKVQNYIRSMSGSHFDPSVVEAFFKIVDSL